MTLSRRFNLFWIGLAIILLLAGGLRFLSFRFSLPYVEHIDEPAYYLGGQEWRGLYDSRGYYAGIPPAYVALNAAAQPLLEVMGVTGLAATVEVLRGVAVMVNLATLICIALTGRLAAGPLAGLVAAAGWGVAPLVVENGVYALPDPFIYLLTALALLLAAAACLQPARRAWCVWSVLAGLLAVLMKYPALPALLAGLLAALWLNFRDWRQWRWLALQIVLIGLTAIWLIFIYGIDFNNLQREGATMQTEGVRNLFDVSRFANNLYQVFVPLQATSWFMVMALAVLAYYYAGRPKHSAAQTAVMALAAALIFSTAWLSGSYSRVDTDKIRYVLPATTAACVLFGLAAQQIIDVLRNKLLARYPTRLQYAAVLVIIPIALFVWLPQFQQTAALVQERRLSDRRVAMRQWFDVNLDPGTVIVNSANHKTFNPLWGGIPARQWVDWWLSENIMEHPVEEWRTQRGMSYAVLSPAQIAEMQTTESGRGYLAQLLPVRDFDEDGWRGPQMSIFRLWRMQTETRIQFGDSIVLVGYDQSAAQARAGESINFRFYWQPLRVPPDNYSLFIHLTAPGDVTPLAQVDGAPAAPERPTLMWTDLSEILISQAFVLNLPAELPAGDYQVRIGLYNYDSGARLTVTDGGNSASDDAYNLSSIAVTV